MTRKRLILFILLAVGILTGTLVVIKLASGYRPDFSARTLRPTGLLVATSVPDGAQLWLDGKLKSATNTTLNLPPDKYLVEIKKVGFSTWKKELIIEKELVTKTDAYLFPIYPDLKALTFTGAANPSLSPDGEKVAFTVRDAPVGKSGIWVLDLTDRPLSLAQGPRQIVKSAPKGRDFGQGEYRWSPDSKQLLVTLKDRSENFLLDTDRLNPETKLIDISQNLPTIEESWQQEEELRQEAQFSKLPAKLLQVIKGKVKGIQFSPDESKILYLATASATIPEKIIPPLPAPNTQPEERDIQPGKIYVYDLKEDKNFFIMDAPKEITPSPQPTTRPTSRFPLPTPISWFPTSKHLFLVQKGKISISEYDNTNWVDVYSGPFENSFAFPFPSGNKILILASLGKDTPPNLYAISLR
jgi:hypothetical protein